MIGGYVIADFEKVSLVSTPKTIDGIYQSFIDAEISGKPIYAKNVVLYDEDYATFIPAVKTGDVAKVITLIDSTATYILTLTVNSNDTVTCERKEI